MNDVGKMIEANIKLEFLRVEARNCNAEKLANHVLNDARFPVWSGSSGPNMHHYGEGGLIQHTWEVWSIASRTLEFYQNSIKRGVMETVELPSKRELFLSVLFHDSGKMWDYHKVDGFWRSAPHKRIIHHISRSAIEWTKAVNNADEGGDIEENVLHAILAHHGQREWGSPVSPKTRLAWMVHISDMMSARMNDADKLDIVKEK
jgi:3'-5' exoribonuclease